MQSTPDSQSSTDGSVGDRKPLLLLDIDGVLCPFGMEFERTATGIVVADRSDAAPEGYEFHPAHNVYISHRNAERVAQLREHFDVHWCTGWLDAANEVIGPLHDLPELPVVNLAYGTIWGEEYLAAEHDDLHWKGSSIVDYVEDRPYAFVDDDIHEVGLMYAKDRTERGIPTFWLKTKHYEGLTDEQVSALIEWAKTVANS